MRFDPATGVLEVSVRELAYQGEVGSSATSFGRLRAELGRAVHERYREERRRDGVESEVPVRLERAIDGALAIVRGRADVLMREGDGWVVEEVKSVMGDAHADPGNLSHAALQARAYALAFDHEARRPIGARLVLVPVDGGAPRVIPLSYDRAATEAELDLALGVCLAAARGEASQRARRAVVAPLLAFPYEKARPEQEALMADIGKALAADRPVLLDAPTGTGKTVVALLPALKEALGRGASVWYLTAKTTQREAVLATFAAILAASALPPRESATPLRAIALRRKEAMCPPGDLACHPERCPFLADFSERAGDALEALSGHAVLSPDRVFEAGVAETLCPYELMHALAAGADLVVGDYNHVYDRGRTQAQMGRRLVVVDEAHNLVDRARGYASAAVPLRAVRALEKAETVPELPAFARRVRKAIAAALEEAALEERAGHDGCAPASLEPSVWRELGVEAGLFALRHAHRKLERIEASPPLERGARDWVLSLLEAIAKLGELASSHNRALVGYVASAAAPSGKGVGIFCLDPAARLERQHRRELGTIAMSATLSPLGYYADVLGMARLDPWLGSAASSFPRENRSVSIVPTIVTTAATRDQSAPAIARLIERVVAVRPGNYAAFFPSFRQLGLAQAMLRVPDSLVVAQPPGASEALRARVLEQLRRADRPTLLLAVAGGIFAEGIDLAGEALIGAIVVGPSLPPADFERRLMQSHHEEEREAGFAYAMAYPGMQRVVQAAGRVHRGPDDRGVIVLVGARFAEPPFFDAIPSHWYDHRPEELFTDDPVPRLERFWSE